MPKILDAPKLQNFAARRKKGMVIQMDYTTQMDEMCIRDSRIGKAALYRLFRRLGLIVGGAVRAVVAVRMEDIPEFGGG